MVSRGYTDSAGRTSIYDPTLSTAHKSGLWHDCPLLEYAHDPAIGVYLNEPFVSYNAASTTGDYILTAATSGTGAISTLYPGCLAITAGAATSTQGVNLQRAKSMFLPASGKDIWFEARVRMETAIIAELFIGLAEIDTTIIGSSAVSTDNHMGWSSVTDDGVMLFNSEKATAGTTAAATTISTSAFINFGFRYDGTADTLQQYINGVATGTAIATANIPKVAVYPSFVCQAAGTGTPVMHFSYRVFQLR